MELLVNLAAYLALPVLFLIISVWKRNIGAMIGGIISFSVVAPFLADDFGGWILAPIVICVLMLCAMLVRDVFEKQVVI